MRLLLALILPGLLCSAAFAASVAVLAEGFDGQVTGHLEGGASLAAGQEGQAVSLSAEARVVYPELEFPRGNGRVEMDICPTAPITPRQDGKHWMLLTDVGAGAAWKGATVIYFERDTGELGYGVFDGGWQWIWARGVDWEVGRWRKVSFTWGPEGRTLGVDGTEVARDDYTAGIEPRAMQLGYFDGWSVAAPLLIDNFTVTAELVDSIRTEAAVVCPVQDGLLDTVEVTWTAASPATVQVGLYRGDEHVARVLAPTETEARRSSVDFAAEGVPSGDYELRLTLTRPEGTATLTAALSVDAELRWQPAPRRMDGRFPLGVWYFWEDDASYIGRFTEDEAAARAYYETTMADLAGLGVDTVIANWTPRAHRDMMLDAAQRNGIDVIVHLDEVNGLIWNPERLKSENPVAILRDAVATADGHPATIGYYLVDEPTPTPQNIANIRLCRQIVEALDPKHPGFSCLNVGWEVIFPAVGYEILLVDIYPLYSAHLQGDVLRGYIASLDRAHAAAAGANWWLIPQCFGFKPRPESIPGPNEFTLLCWEAIAHGAKGLIHFIYQSTTDVQGEWLRGIVDEDLRPMDHRYEEVRRLHAALGPIKDKLLTLTRSETCPATCGDGFDVQAFTDPEGGRYLVVVNQSITAQAEAELSFEAPVAGVADVAGGETVGAGKLASLHLPAGTGRLLRIVEEE